MANVTLLTLANRIEALEKRVAELEAVATAPVPQLTADEIAALTKRGPGRPPKNGAQA